MNQQKVPMGEPLASPYPKGEPLASPYRMRQGKDNAFKKDWEDGYDPSKPCIEVKDTDGNVTQKRPVSKSYDVCDMTDEELGDFLGEDEKKALKEARKQRKETAGRDMCKEYHEKKKKDEQKRMNSHETLTQVNEAQNSKINELQAIIVQHNELLAQIVSKLNTPV